MGRGVLACYPNSLLKRTIMKKPDFIPLSPEEDIVTPERVAKGDLDVRYNSKKKIDSAAVRDNVIIKELIRLRVLDTFHEIYGLSFLELRAAFRAPWAPKCSAVLLEQWGTGVSMSKATEIYQNVCREFLGGRGLEIIQYALEMEISEENKIVRIAKYSNGLYQEFFEKLVGVLDAEREKRKKEEQK